jgi:microcystin-dependent protein
MSNNCSNCYNGCVEITSDKCIKYTGVDVPILGIKNGDSLSFIEQSLITFLTSTLDGTGIFPVIDSNDVCVSVQENLPVCDPLSLNNYITALLKTLCELEAIVSSLPNANPDEPYDLQCITSTSDTSTVIVVQSVIDKVCDLNTQLTNFIAYVNATFVKISDVNTYIANYLTSQPTQTAISNRMVPFSAVPYYGTLSNFDASGAGLGDWDKIYLCNGQNGTPDLRGRVLVGATTGMGGGAMNSAVDPSISTNPNYALATLTGSNSVILSVGQLPAHTHANTVSSTISPNPHNHGWTGQNGTGRPDGGIDHDAVPGNSDSYPWATQQLDVNLSVNTSITNVSTGGGLGHSNYQPGFGSYFIIYIP